MKKVCRLVNSFVVLTSLIAANTYGEVLISGLVNPSFFDFENPVTVGYSFRTPAYPVAVTALGMLDQGGRGFGISVDVGLWNIAGTLLEQITLSAGTVNPLIDGFRYDTENSPPVVLSPNSIYVLGAYRPFGVAYWAEGDEGPIEGVDFTTSADFDIIDDRASSDISGELGIEFPDYVFNLNQALIGPNMIYFVVPEPGSMLFATVLLVGCIVGRLRKV